MTSGTIAVTAYCERITEGFWAEPVNALTNLAFLIASVVAGRTLRRTATSPRDVWDLWLLVGLAVCIGCGSFLWHTLATPWTEWADVFPILLFMSVFLLGFLHRIAQLGLPAIGGWFLPFQGANFGLSWVLPPDLLHGSVFYLPAWVALLLIAGYSNAICWPRAQLFLKASLVFTISIGLRTLDRPICEVWPMGTHFGWHLLNGYVVYAVIVALLPQDNNN